MNRKNVYITIILSVLLFSTSGMLFVGLAKANMMPMQIPQPAVIIRANGAVDPATAPIQRDGNVYTLTDDVVGYTIGFECDDVTVDGNGYSLLGNGSKSTGVFILNKNGITIKNLNIRNSTYGIRVYAESYFGASASDNKLLNNTVTNCGSGIILSSSSNTLLRNNVMTNNTYNFGVQGIYTNDVDDSNLVDGRPIIYWVKQQNKTVPSNAGYVAIVNCTNVVVQGLSLVNNVQGVVLCYTEDSTVTKNTVTNTTDAVYIYGSTNNNVTENTLTFNGCGMKVYTASNNSISLNNITNNTDGIIATSASTGNTFSKNTVTSNSADGMNIDSATNTDIQENIVTNNTENGILFFECTSNRITENTITDNGNGIKLWFHTSYNNITENHVANNSIGILVDDSYDNLIFKNMITENSDWGMQLVGSQNNNMIYYNSFIDNANSSDGLQVSIPGVSRSVLDMTLIDGHGNVWDNGTVGNYWSDYLTRYPDATEIAGTGIGNTQFYINANNYDRYPLMEPVSIPEFPSWTVLIVAVEALAVATLIFKRKISNASTGC